MLHSYTSKIKKVLYLSPLPPPPGGISIWTEKLVRYGLPNGFNIELVNLNSLQSRNTHEKAEFEAKEIKRTLDIILNLIKQLIKFKPHLIHLNCSLSPMGIFRDYLFGVIIKITGKKLVSHYHGNIPDFSKISFKRLSFVFLKKLIRISDANIALNKVSYDYINNIASNEKRNKSFQLPNYIDDYFFYNNHSTARKREKSKNLKAIYVGSITKEKGACDIIKVAKKFTEIEFVLIGNIINGSIPSLSELPSNITILHPSSNEIVLKEMRRSDFLLFLSYSEGFPIVVLEAMVMGLPVIATRVGAIPEMIDEGKGGFLCNPGDYKDIVDAIVKLKILSNISKLGQYNFIKAKNKYSYSSIISKLCDIYENIW